MIGALPTAFLLFSKEFFENSKEIFDFQRNSPIFMGGGQGPGKSGNYCELSQFRERLAMGGNGWQRGANEGQRGGHGGERAHNGWQRGGNDGATMGNDGQRWATIGNDGQRWQRV